MNLHSNTSKQHSTYANLADHNRKAVKTTFYKMNGLLLNMEVYGILILLQEILFFDYEKDLNDFYDKMKGVYKKIFDRS